AGKTTKEPRVGVSSIHSQVTPLPQFTAPAKSVGAIHIRAAEIVHFVIVPSRPGLRKGPKNGIKESSPPKKTRSGRKTFGQRSNACNIPIPARKCAASP